MRRSSQYIPELWQFIQTGLPHDLPPFGDPWVIVPGMLHTTELVNIKRFSLDPYPLLFIKNRAFWRQFGDGRQYGKKGES